MNDMLMNKDKWVRLFREIGLDEETMALWHRKFEASYPEAHQSFLEWLNIAPDEISRIRAL